MKSAPQEIRTFFVTTVCSGRRRLLQSDRSCSLLLEILQDHQAKGRYLVHEFVIMPDHLHMILTPGESVSLEKAVQFLKGGYSFEEKKRFGIASIGNPVSWSIELKMRATMKIIATMFRKTLCAPDMYRRLKIIDGPRRRRNFNLRRFHRGYGQEPGAKAQARGRELSPRPEGRGFHRVGISDLPPDMRFSSSASQPIS